MEQLSRMWKETESRAHTFQTTIEENVRDASLFEMVGEEFKTEYV